MEILHIIPTIDKKYGGPVHSLESFVEVNERLGMDAEILTTNSENPYQYGDTPINSFKKSFPVRLSRSKDANKWLRNNHGKFDFAVFHGVWSYFHFDLAKICRSTGLKYAVRPHSNLDPKDLQKKKYLKKIAGPLYVKKYLQGADKLICTAKPEEDRLVTYGANVDTVIAPLPIKPISNTDSSKENTSKIRFLFLSRIDYKKGLDLFIKALGQLNKNEIGMVELKIAGDGTDKYKKHIKTIISDLNLEEKIKFLGFVTGEQKEKAFRDSDVFILTSYFENFGYAVVEALERGLPVLISKEVDIWKDIKKYNAGWFCEYEVGSITQTLKEIIEGEDFIVRKKNANKAASQFHIENVVEKHQKIYSDIAI